MRYRQITKTMLFILLCDIIFVIILFMATKSINTEHVDSGKKYSLPKWLNGSEDHQNEKIIEATEVMNIDYGDKRDSIREKFISSLIVGQYTISSEVNFNFGLNGIYSGFFDATQKGVNGFSYEPSGRKSVV